MVISASGNSLKFSFTAFITAQICSGQREDGVPPPTNTEITGKAASASRPVILVPACFYFLNQLLHIFFSGDFVRRKGKEVAVQTFFNAEWDVDI